MEDLWSKINKRRLTLVVKGQSSEGLSLEETQELREIYDALLIYAHYFTLKRPLFRLAELNGVN